MLRTEFEPIGGYKTPYDYKKLITNTEFWNPKGPIPLEFNDYRIYDYVEGWEPRFGDIHLWVAVTPSANYYLIVSKRLMELIKGFNLPQHTWYEADLSIYKETRRYYVLHMLDRRFEELCFPKSRFTLKEKRMPYKEIQELDIGFIKSKEEERKLGLKYFLEQKQLLEPKVLYYKKSYDIFWGRANGIYINEKVKEAMEGMGIEPFEAVPISTKVIMAGT
jgi:hypothetical protein